MIDNNLRLSFDYRYPDEAVELYSELTGKPVEDIKKEAGYTKYDG